MKKILTLLILVVSVLATAAWPSQQKGVKSAASAVPQATLPDTLALQSDTLSIAEGDKLPSAKEEATDVDAQTATASKKSAGGISLLWILLPTAAFLFFAIAYRNVRRRYNKVKERLDDAEQQLDDVRLLQNADKEQINKYLEQMEKDKAWLSRQKTDAERARQLADEEVEKLMNTLKSQQAENDQLCEKNMQLSKQVRQLTDQYSQLKADIANTATSVLTNDTREPDTSETPEEAPTLTDYVTLSDRTIQCASLLDAICQQVRQTEGASPVITATLRQMQASLAEMQQALHLSPSTLRHTQEVFVKCLRPSGWMNNAAQLFAYSRLPQLCKQLQQNGMNIAMLEQLTGQAQALLGTVDMSMMIPAVLAADFDKDAYDYQNGDVWINKMFTGITSRDFEGKVFDILQVGYSIGSIKTKPVVKF